MVLKCSVSHQRLLHPKRVAMYRPPVGIPRREQTRWQGWLLSLLAHLLLLLLILVPRTEPDIDLGHREGAGGTGPAGGGGGGRGDDAGPRLQFVQMAPVSRAITTPPVVVPAVVPPKVQPVPTPPKAPPIAPPTAAITPQTPAQPAPANAAAPASGTGTGVGQNGGVGAGTGTGGGVGSGEGTGRGSATGPGTGGGTAQIHPPTPRQLFLPPLPAPSSVKGFKLTAWFDVDSTGKATLLHFTPTPDGDYNKRLRETLMSLRFRPAVRPDGVAVRDTFDMLILF